MNAKILHAFALVLSSCLLATIGVLLLALSVQARIPCAQGIGVDESPPPSFYYEHYNHFNYPVYFTFNCPDPGYDALPYEPPSDMPDPIYTVGCGDPSNGQYHFASYWQNMPNITQFTNGTSTDNLSNVSCGAASGTSVLQKLNQSLPGLVNMSGTKLIEELRNRSLISKNGINERNLILAMIELILQSKYKDDVTIHWYANTAFTNTSRNFTYLNKTVTVFKTNIYPNVSVIHDEFYTKHEHTMVCVESFTFGYKHFMVLEDFEHTANANGKYNISFMDPWGDGQTPGSAGTIYGEMAYDGVFTLGNETLQIKEVITFSPNAPH
ncbi:MAG: hypothetical protein V1743_02410 [Nanoarchaeota archaeon]